jgi:hypothetical protein
MRRSMLVGVVVSSMIASCAVEDTDSTEQAINSDQCIFIGGNPIGPETLCGPFARRWASVSQPLASYGWPLAGWGDWGGTLGRDLGIPASNDVMVFERGMMNAGPVSGADCQSTACNSLLGRWYVQRTFTTPLVEGGPIPAGSPDCGNTSFFKARELGCVTGPLAGSFTQSYNLTGGLTRNGFPLSPVLSFGSNGGRPYVVTERNVYDYFPENAQPWTWPGRLIGRDYLSSKGLNPARTKPRTAKCLCSGGPACPGAITEPVLDSDGDTDHDRCTAATKRACDRCPAGCTRTARGCNYK